MIVWSQENLLSRYRIFFGFLIGFVFIVIILQKLNAITILFAVFLSIIISFYWLFNNNIINVLRQNFMLLLDLFKTQREDLNKNLILRQKLFNVFPKINGFFSGVIILCWLEDLDVYKFTRVSKVDYIQFILTEGDKASIANFKPYWKLAYWVTSQEGLEWMKINMPDDKCLPTL